MYSLLLLAGVSFLSCLLLTPLCRNLFRKWGFVDLPDDKRKLHSEPIPRVGGVAIALAFVISFGALLISPLHGKHIVALGLYMVWRVLPAASIIFVTGLLDDLLGLKPWQKLSGQILAASVAFEAGVHVVAIGGFHLPVWANFLVTVVWIVGCANAFNLIDGMDGLAAGVGLFATLTMIVSALMNNRVELAMATVPMAGALLAFLRFNFNPASIFLGDCGSLTIGFLLGCYGLFWNDKSATLLGMTAPLMALSIPLLDTAIAIARRFLRRQPIFRGDRGHIHHRLLDRGLTPRRVVLVLYGVCTMAAVLSILQNVFNEKMGGLVLILFCGSAWLGVQHLGYVEFGTATRMLASGAFRRLLSSHIALAHFESTLRNARSANECWETIRASYQQFGFNSIDITLGPMHWTDRISDGLYHNGWNLRIALLDAGYIVLSRDADVPPPPVVAPYADVLGKTLRRKITELHLPGAGSAYQPRINAKAMSAAVGR